MGLFNKLFGNKKYKVNKTKVNSRYSFEVLSTAYSNIWERQNIDMLTISVNSVYTEEVEIYFHTERKIADILMFDFFKVFSQADMLVQDDDICNYDISYFNVYDNEIGIGYWGNENNIDFEVNLFRNNGLWYLTRIGARKFNPPKCVSYRE